MSIEQTFSAIAGDDVRYLRHSFFCAPYFGKPARRMEIQFDAPRLGKKGFIAVVCEEPVDENETARECAYAARDWVAHKIRKAAA